MDRRLFVLPAAVVPLTAGAAYYLRRRRAAAAAGATGPAPETPAAEAVSHSAQCRCGQEVRVIGEGRHVVFWPGDATLSDPLLDGKCPACGKDLAAQGLTGGGATAS